MARSKIIKALKDAALGVNEVAKRTGPIHGKVKFIRVRGRIVPIHSKTAKSARTTSEMMKRISRGKAQSRISKKTSFAMKKISAVRSVRKFRIKLNSTFKDIKQLGEGFEAVAYEYKGKVIKQVLPIIAVTRSDGFLDTVRQRFIERGFIKQALHKHGLAPETFTIATKRRAYLVEGKARETAFGKIVRGLGKDEKTKAVIRNRVDYGIDDLKDNIEKLGIKAFDVHSDNVGVFGRKLKVIDAGHFQLSSFKSFSDLKKQSEKFTIVSKKSRESLGALRKRFLFNNYDLVEHHTKNDMNSQQLGDLIAKILRGPSKSNKFDSFNPGRAFTEHRREILRKAKKKK